MVAPEGLHRNEQPAPDLQVFRDQPRVKLQEFSNGHSIALGQAKQGLAPGHRVVLRGGSGRAYAQDEHSEECQDHFFHAFTSQPIMDPAGAEGKGMF